MNKASPGSAIYADIGVGASLRTRQTVAGQIFDSLREAIRTGVLKDGDELNQVDLAEHFGVSRVPIREAMRALEAEGWIKAPTNQRAFVHRLSLEEIVEIFEMRELIEVDLVGKAVGKIDSKGLDALKDLCARMEEATQQEAWLAYNSQFHERLLASSGRTVAIGVVGHLASQVERYLRPRGAGPVRQEQANAEHRMIIAAIEQGDRAAVRALLKKHIRTTRRLVVSNLSRA